MSSDIRLRALQAERLVREAGDRILDAYHQDIRFDLKGLQDYVTELDIQIENIIKQEIALVFPEDAFYGEETDNVRGKNEWRWIVDPIDGTNNFRRGIPMAGSQIAIEEKGRIVYSVIFQPFIQELYWAELNQGAFCKNLLTRKTTKLHVSDRGLKDAFVIYDAGVVIQNSYSANQLDSLKDLIEGGRILGVAAMDFPLVASGAIELLITSVAEAYDIAPGLLLVHEAGGSVTNENGGDWKPDDNIVIVGNGVANTELISKGVHNV